MKPKCSTADWKPLTHFILTLLFAMGGILLLVLGNPGGIQIFRSPNSPGTKG